jgi:hypothetical protein
MLCFLYFICNTNNLNLTPLLSLLVSKYPPPQLSNLSYHGYKLVFSRLTSVRILCQQQSCHNSFQLVVIFKFMASKILLHICRRILLILWQSAKVVVTEFCATQTYLLTYYCINGIASSYYIQIIYQMTT